MKNWLIKDGKIRYLNIVLIITPIFVFLSFISKFIDANSAKLSPYDGLLTSFVMAILFIHWLIIIFNQTAHLLNYLLSKNLIKIQNTYKIKQSIAFAKLQTIHRKNTRKLTFSVLRC